MKSEDFLALIEQRLGALQERLEAVADRRLTAEVKRAIDIARVDLPFALVKARYVLWDLASGKQLAVLAGHSGAIHSVAFSPDGRTLVSGSVDDTLRLWDMDRLEVAISGNTDASALQDWISAVESRVRWHLKGLDIEPIAPERNLYGQPTAAPRWSPNHPNHWLPAAEASDTTAMVHIGLIYDRSNENDRALAWYRKAAAAGNEEGAKRLEFLEDWLQRRKPAASPSP